MVRRKEKTVAILYRLCYDGRNKGAYVDVDLLKKTVRKHSLELEEHAKILYRAKDRAVD